MKITRSYQQTNTGLNIAACDTHTMAAVRNDLWVMCDNNFCGQTGLDKVYIRTFTKVDHPFDDSGIKSIACHEKCSMVLTNLGNIFISGEFNGYISPRFVQIDTLSNIHLIKCIGKKFFMVGGYDVTVHIFGDTMYSVSLGLHIDEINQIFHLSDREVILETGKGIQTYSILSDYTVPKSFSLEICDLQGTRNTDFISLCEGMMRIEYLDILENRYRMLLLVKLSTLDDTEEKYYILAGRYIHKILNMNGMCLNNPRIFSGPSNTFYLCNETSYGGINLHKLKLKFYDNSVMVSSTKISTIGFFNEKINNIVVSSSQKFFVFENSVYCDNEPYESDAVGCDGRSFRIHPFLTELLHSTQIISRTKKAT